MVGVSKVYKSNRMVLKDIYLSFFYGAKIGVLGLNGSGKSTLLRIIAGLDDDYLGTISSQKGIRFGYLEQEPLLNEEKTVLEVVQEGVQSTMDLLNEYEKVNEGFSDPDADFEALIARQAKLQEELDRIGAWYIDLKLNHAMDPLPSHPPDTPLNVLPGGESRSGALCRLLLDKPDVLLLDEPTNHHDPESVHRLEQHFDRYERTVIPVTHDRYCLDNVPG